jgi:septum formation protein
MVQCTARNIGGPVSDPADIHPLWLGGTPLVLASGSRTRLELLIAAGIPVEVVPPMLDERAIAAPLERRGVSAARVAMALATAKALSVADERPGRTILGADQVLACDGVMLHKPVNRAAAAGQLAFLSGRVHHLHAAVTIALDKQTVARFVGKAKLTMRILSPAMVERYLDASGDRVLDSVGGYQLERVGIHLFSRIGGDHSTILGLPMVETLKHLRRLMLVAE